MKEEEAKSDDRANDESDNDGDRGHQGDHDSPDSHSPTLFTATLLDTAAGINFSEITLGLSARPSFTHRLRTFDLSFENA